MSEKPLGVVDFAALPPPNHEIERLKDARALHGAAVMLMTEGLERDFHFFALHMRVAIVELEEQMGALAPPSQRVSPLSNLPKALRRKPEISAQLASLIRREAD
jgi:hypothetical protein